MAERIKRKQMLQRLTAAILCCLLLCQAAGFPSASAEEQPKFLAMGFDDLRWGDQELVLPMLFDYEMSATFNRIAYSVHMAEEDAGWIEWLTGAGNELGDHTWFHVNYIYSDPLFNGQDPLNPEGGQQAFPSNEQLRKDAGDGKNAFGFDLNASVSESLQPWAWEWEYDGMTPEISESWANLPDKACQEIRNWFSVYRHAGIMETLDELSNTYLGTSGTSAGSWNDTEGCYTGGIFTGCRTSQNHEIWERILEATRLCYEAEAQVYGFDFEPFRTWSWPGPLRDIFLFRTEDGVYYDEEHTKRYNYLAKFPSSLKTDEAGKPLERSWTDALRGAGYTMSHDFLCPSRADGQETPMMSRQLFLNASLSRGDALAYPTNRTVTSQEAAEDYPDSFFDWKSEKSAAAQMYDAGGAFYRCIEAIRHDTASGLVHGEVIDSEDTPSEKVFLRGILNYCRTAGVQVVSKKTAYAACFGEVREEGNLMYNPGLRNTAKEYLPDAEAVPVQPDGYTGGCTARPEGEEPALIVSGTASHIHYGIPLGEILYSAKALGTGEIRIFAVRNRDSAELTEDDLTLLGKGSAAAGAQAETITISFTVKDEPETEWEPLCEGLGKKIMGILIVYEGDFQLTDQRLEKTGSR